MYFLNLRGGVAAERLFKGEEVVIDVGAAALAVLHQILQQRDEVEQGVPHAELFVLQQEHERLEVLLNGEDVLGEEDVLEALDVHHAVLVRLGVEELLAQLQVEVLRFLAHELELQDLADVFAGGGAHPEAQRVVGDERKQIAGVVVEFAGDLGEVVQVPCLKEYVTRPSASRMLLSARWLDW